MVELLLAPRLAEDGAILLCALFSYVYNFSSLLFLLVKHLQCLSILDVHKNNFWHMHENQVLA